MYQPTHLTGSLPPRPAVNKRAVQPTKRLQGGHAADRSTKVRSGDKLALSTQAPAEITLLTPEEENRLWDAIDKGRAAEAAALEKLQALAGTVTEERSTAAASFKKIHDAEVASLVSALHFTPDVQSKEDADVENEDDDVDLRDAEKEGGCASNNAVDASHAEKKADTLARLIVQIGDLERIRVALAPEQKAIAKANQAKTVLVSKHQPLVWSLATHYKNGTLATLKAFRTNQRLQPFRALRAPADYTRDDLIRDGNLGLVKAIYSFDRTQGARLCTYATANIVEAMRDSSNRGGTNIYIPPSRLVQIYMVKKRLAAIEEKQGFVTDADLKNAIRAVVEEALSKKKASVKKSDRSKNPSDKPVKPVSATERERRIQAAEAILTEAYTAHQTAFHSVDVPADKPVKPISAKERERRIQSRITILTEAYTAHQTAFHSVDAPARRDEGGTTILDLIGRPSEDGLSHLDAPEDVVSRAQLEAKANEMFWALLPVIFEGVPDAQRKIKILKMRVLENKTLEEVSGYYGGSIGKERVRQIQEKTEARIHVFIQEKIMEDGGGLEDFIEMAAILIQDYQDRAKQGKLMKASPWTDVEVLRRFAELQARNKATESQKAEKHQQVAEFNRASRAALEARISELKADVEPPLPETPVALPEITSAGKVNADEPGAIEGLKQAATAVVTVTESGSPATWSVVSDGEGISGKAKAAQSRFFVDKRTRKAHQKTRKSDPKTVPMQKIKTHAIALIRTIFSLPANTPRKEIETLIHRLCIKFKDPALLDEVGEDLQHAIEQALLINPILAQKRNVMLVDGLANLSRGKRSL